jgi:propanol-preferring alcohol dehydrogenase
LKKGKNMKAMVLEKMISSIEEEPGPLRMVELPIPNFESKQILVKILACGICHTELDEIEGRLLPKLPVILGHQIVGIVSDRGKEVKRFNIGDRVGIGWIYSSCGKCYHCRIGNENLCEEFQSTGCEANGGYAEYTIVSEDFAYLIPEILTVFQAVPLLCAGAIGYRALKLSGIEDDQTLGIYGFGASAHIVIQVVKYKFPDCKVFVFTRSKKHRDMAKKLGADWVGVPADIPPWKHNCAIDFTPVGITVREALRNLENGGKVVVNVIRKATPVPELDYTHDLWHEKELKSVANITRKDIEEFLILAAEIPIIPEIQEFALAQANEALLLLDQGKINGVGILKMEI